ncbi:NAD(P)/FAD-dependent oxidoreductase [Fervidobacterium islandicum]|uniref:NAD(P)/FAD-dependent oxidoreductase n=1 Tax=Fervidobacterium islandicum TaxID=2423 RepID=A0AAI8CKA3_FERIS|nr:NAD(P)/FAD-dependent oxidoreductase [Fervidobacterium islandicum]AMW31959.1 NAD(P)/FAD-dependent oxidoreductase [Fervidobacterium islandicum]
MKVGIIGGGPAGVACAVLLKRYGVDVTIYEKEEIGGLIRNAWRVENFPPVGFISGIEFANRLKWYVEEYKIEVVKDEILSVDEYKLAGINGKYQCDIAVIATGTEAKRIEQLEGPKTFYEYVELPKDIGSVAIYGGGDVALDYAIHAKEDGMEPIVFVRSDRLKAVSRLVEYAMQRGIVIKLKEPVAFVEHNDKNVYIYTKTGSYVVDAFLIAIGREGKMPKVTAKSMPVHVIGDAAHPDIRQSSIAIGDGIRCAMEIVEQLIR